MKLDFEIVSFDFGMNEMDFSSYKTYFLTNTGEIKEKFLLPKTFLYHGIQQDFKDEETKNIISDLIEDSSMNQLFFEINIEEEIESKIH